MTRIRRNFLLLIGVLAVTGCVSLKTSVTGVEFLGTTEEPEAALRALAKRIVNTTTTTSQVHALLGPEARHVAWGAQFRLDHEQESYTWRFAHVEQKKWGLAVTSGSTTVTRGYQLVVGFVDGTLVGAQVEATDLSEREKEWTTTAVLSLGAAGLGTLFMLRAQ